MAENKNYATGVNRCAAYQVTDDDTVSTNRLGHRAAIGRIAPTNYRKGAYEVSAGARTPVQGVLLKLTTGINDLHYWSKTDPSRRNLRQATGGKDADTGGTWNVDKHFFETVSPRVEARATAGEPIARRWAGNDTGAAFSAFAKRSGRNRRA